MNPEGWMGHCNCYRLPRTRGSWLSCRLARRSCSISHAYRLMSSFSLPLISLLWSYLVVRHEHCKLTNKGREFLTTKRLTVSRFTLFFIFSVFFVVMFYLFRLFLSRTHFRAFILVRERTVLAVTLSTRIRGKPGSDIGWFVGYLTRVSRVFSSSFWASVRMVARLDYNCFRPTPFHLIMRLSS